MKTAPTPDEVEEVYLRLLEGDISRDEAERWAAQWVASEHELLPDYIWEALDRLYGCDLRQGPDQPYLHSEEQLGEWLEIFRRQRHAPSNASVCLSNSLPPFRS